jgi:uncharacterized protein YbjT (DUF2867 family)
VTGARGVLGRILTASLRPRAVTFDRADGQELADRAALAAALAGCDAVVHLAALHPLVAPRDADERTYHDANVVPFSGLLDAMSRHHVRRIVFASSTSVWRESEPGTPARFVDETAVADGADPYARSKRECERLLEKSGLDRVTLWLARFARAGDPEDEVRKLYRAIDPRDIAAAVFRTLDIARRDLVSAPVATPRVVVREETPVWPRGTQPGCRPVQDGRPRAPRRTRSAGSCGPCAPRSRV